MAPTWSIVIITVWISLSAAFPSLSELPHLSTNDNNLEKVFKSIDCPSKCHCTNLQNNLAIDCKSQKLKNVPFELPPSVVYLNLVGNEIVRLSHNSSLKNLNFLIVSQNQIQSLDDLWLSTLENIKVLDLSFNSLHALNSDNIFKNSALEELNLSNNRLDTITNVLFNNLNNLLTLNLSFNEIEIIKNDSFQFLTQLKTLDLGSNKLTDLHHEWFRNLHSLESLILKSNKLTILRNVVFSTLKNLKYLDLTSNSIKSVGLLSFKGLVNLQFLNLSYNDISIMQTNIFRPLKSLNVIDLSSNKFSNIDNIFFYTKELKVLYLKYLSNFESLTPYSFSDLRNLEKVDLSHSNLSYVDLKSFNQVQNLRHLDLSFANLRSLKMGVFSHLRKVEVLKLNDNPWKCDCYLYWLLTWLAENGNTHLLSPSKTFCYSPAKLKNHVMLDALDLSMVCTNASIHSYTNKTKFKVGFPALLECQVEGSPKPSLTWITPQNIALHWTGYQNDSTEPQETESATSQSVSDERFYLMPNGNLAIKAMERGDGGFYVCAASNPLSYVSVSIRLTLDYEYFVHIKIVSILVGLATSFGFLLMTLVFVLIKMILKHFGIKCPCRSGSASPQTQQIKKILESMEHYKKQQLDRLRDNYNGQVQKIKDNCMQQMERLRESYSSQAERLRDIKEYGTLQIDRIRDNYYSQVQRVRDYSASQIIRLRENYIFQRTRIRKFSAHHLYKLRENYKVQQQHLNKILENLNIESCRNVCQRTESVIFEPEIFENVLVPKICLQTFNKETCDSNDTSSQISAYFTPEEAGSEISGHDSDDQESLCNIPNPDCSAVVDVVITENVAHTLDLSENNVENTSSSESISHITVCNSGETIV